MCHGVAALVHDQTVTQALNMYFNYLAEGVVGTPCLFYSMPCKTCSMSCLSFS